MSPEEERRALLARKGLLGRISGFEPPQKPAGPPPHDLALTVEGVGRTSYFQLGPGGYRRIGKA